jgi:anaerobic selenocysteine-containing dehydrogenase
VRLETTMGGIRLKAKLNPSLHPKVVATQYGWWQDCKELGLPGYNPFTRDGANVNLIIPNEASDPISGAVAHRSQPCRVIKLAHEGTARRPSLGYLRCSLMGCMWI